MPTFLSIFLLVRILKLFLCNCVLRVFSVSQSQFLRATAGTAIARLSHRNSVRLSVRPSVCPSVTRVDQAKTVQARIIKSLPSAAPRTLVSGSVTLFQKFRRGHPNRGP